MHQAMLQDRRPPDSSPTARRALGPTARRAARLALRPAARSGSARLACASIAFAFGFAWATSVGAAAQDSPETQRFVRFEHDGVISWGIEIGDEVRPLAGATLFEAAAAADTGEWATAVGLPANDVRFLTPVDPDQTSKVIGVAVNTRRPGRMDPIPHPRWFAKFPTSLNHATGPIELPPEATNLNYEGELVLVIGREGRHIPESEARDHVFGVTVGNDYSENTWYGERNGVDEPTRMISKGTDSWAPIGRAIVRGIDYSDLRLTTTLNGEVVQDGRTSDLVNSIDNLISHVSRYITLKPGDVIFTGTVLFNEGARRRMEPGDVVEVSIEGLGSVRNEIVAMPGGL